MTTHEKYKAMKKALGLTNADIAEIIGISPNSVKNQTQSSKELPTWAKSMIFVWEKLKADE
ncbi:sigma factor-like helix-turn-helix DNA-binding protein [Marinifilum flexuosum]|uniref:Sigma-70-like protein n=1 Tax=Marinifilum flexuosum TaxID=1117708 RepID=A0A419WMV6_9BACT|nr:sigma factor-like helix-turn-helix DNA-binding protein [Marinifilum flexuosum]RKD96744.1 sigma-70-like protein [Marinifilum flexuosum]